MMLRAQPIQQHRVSEQDDNRRRQRRRRSYADRPIQSDFLSSQQNTSSVISPNQPPNVIESETAVAPLLSPPTLLLRRPVAMRPQDAVAFYKETEQLKLPSAVVHSAVQESHAWHRKWTTEEGRLQEENAADQAINDMLLDREGGARNPSPRDVIEDEEDRQQQHKRGRDSMLARNLLTKQKTKEDEAAPVEAPKLIRPKAMRIGSSAALVEAEVPVVAAPAAALSQSNKPPTNTSSDNDTLLTRSRPGPIPSMLIATANDIDDRCISPLTLDTCMMRDDDEEQEAALSKNLAGRSIHAPTMMVQPEGGAHVILEEGEEEVDATAASMLISDASSAQKSAVTLQQARETLLQELAVTGGETTTDRFQSALTVLQEQQETSLSSPILTSYTDTLSLSSSTNNHAGLWLTMTKPTFFDCLGDNENGDPMYTLGRMSFGLCAPSNLICSLQGNFNRIERVTSPNNSKMMNIPKSLREEVGVGTTVLETYNIITAFTIEPHSPSFPSDAPNRDVQRPIRGLMTTYGYIIPDPLTPNRHTVWITGGRLEPNDCPQDVADWKRLFAAHPPQHTLAEHAKLLAVQWLMGATLPAFADDDAAALEYTFERPLGGHGLTYLDTLYEDKSLRVVRGHRGTTFVFARTEG